MNCESLREQLTAEPTREHLEFDGHAESCAPCRAFRDRLLRVETLIGEALRFDVAGLANASRPGDSDISRSIGRFRLIASLAAALVVAVAVWVISGPPSDVSTEQLSDAVIGHWDHEPESLAVTDLSVPGALLAEVLGGTAELNVNPGTVISFAKICNIGGQSVPHLVVQGEQGPFMVVLFPGRQLASPVPLESRSLGLAGHILPAGSGSIAILGDDSGELAEIEMLVADSIGWAI